MGRKIFQGIVIFVAMFFWSFGTLLEAGAGSERVKPEEFPQVVQLPSTGNRKLFHPPLNDENDLEGTQKIETGSTPEPEPEQNEEEAKNDLEATFAPVLEEPAEIIEETQMNAVSAKLRYYHYRSDWDGIQILLWVGWWILMLSYSCYYCYYYYNRPAETSVDVLVITDRTSEGENLDSTQV